MYQYRVRSNGFNYIFEYIKLDSEDWKPLMTVPKPEDPQAQGVVLAAFINWIAAKSHV